MKKFKEFDDIKEQMINPLDNPEFYAMLIGDTRYYGFTEDSGAFSLCHNYELGRTTHESWFELWRLAINEFLNNVSYKQFLERFPGNSEEGFEILRRKMQKILESDTGLERLKTEKIAMLKQILRVGRDSIDEKNKMPYNRGWFYFRSNALNPGDIQDEIKSENIKHRLYLTIDSENRAKMCSRIMTKAKEKGLPYYFKVHINFNKRKENQQSDTIVIYLSDENQVVEYVNFINEILYEDKNLQGHTYKASPHLGIIDEYIGYGFEPKMEVGTMSYSQLLKKSVSGCNTKKMAIDIFGFLSDKIRRYWYDKLIPESGKFCKPSELDELKLESPEKYEELLEKIKKGTSKPEEYEMIRKNLSVYFKRENMDVEEIDILRKRMPKRLIELYPQLPRDNMFNIDVDELKFEMVWEEDEEER